MTLKEIKERVEEIKRDLEIVFGKIDNLNDDIEIYTSELDRETVDMIYEDLIDNANIISGLTWGTDYIDEE